MARRGLWNSPGFRAQRRRPGQWQRPGQGAEAGACPTSCRRTAGSRGFAGHLSHVPRGWPCPAETWRGQPRPGASRGGPEGVGPVGPCGRIADGPRHTDKPPVASGRGLWDQAMAAERAWKLTRSAFDSSRPKAASTIGNRPRRLWRRRAPLERSGMGQDPAVVAPPRELHVPGHGNGVWLSWDWTPTLSALLDLEGLHAKPGDCRSQRRVSRDTGSGVGPHGRTGEGRTPLAGISWAGL